jgi:hypothetical protein
LFSDFPCTRSKLHFAPLGFPAKSLQRHPNLAVSSRPIRFANPHSALSNKTGTAVCSKKARASFGYTGAILFRKISVYNIVYRELKLREATCIL